MRNKINEIKTKNLFIIMGLPAVGKTTITKNLKKVLNDKDLNNIEEITNNNFINFITVINEKTTNYITQNQTDNKTNSKIKIALNKISSLFVTTKNLKKTEKQEKELNDLSEISSEKIMNELIIKSENDNQKHNDIPIIQQIKEYMLTVQFNNKHNNQNIYIIEEDELFLQYLHNKYKELPKFKDYKEFSEWKNKNKFIARELSKKINGKTFYESTYDSIYNEVIKISQENKDNIYILDTGGYSFNRKMNEGIKIYIEYNTINDFYNRYKKRYNINGKLLRWIPYHNEFIEINELNYKHYYKLINEIYKNKSNYTITNTTLKDTVLRIKNYILSANY